MIRKVKVGFFVSIFILSVSVVGCGGQATDTTVTNPSTSTQTPESNTPAATSDSSNLDKPIELVIHGGGVTDVLFEQVIEPAIQAKYPNIKLSLVRGNLEELLASGVRPDLVSGAGIALTNMVGLDLPEDMSPLIQQFNVDLSRVEPAIVNEMKEIGSILGGDGAILGLPFWMSYGTTIYNKDIFDKFGYDYPSDVLTWDDMLETARRMTRVQDDILYIGSSFTSFINIFKQYGAPYVDENNHAYLTSEAHRSVAELIQNFFRIPNYVEGQTYTHNTFTSKQNVAMASGWISNFVNPIVATPPTFEWDLASYPVFSDQPDLGAPVDYLILMVSKSSQYKEAAFRVITELLTDEVQLKVNQVGAWVTVLDDLSIKQTYAKELHVLEGKNLEAVFSVSPTSNPSYTDHVSEVNAQLNELARKMALEQVDINTVLREAEEAANHAIRDKVK